jgi:3-methyladenine DNA glycosylase AlkD
LMEQSIREQLNELAEEKYKIFTSVLTPGKENILGVRIPILKKMGVRIIKGDWRTYLEQAKDDTMEEVMLQGMVIGGCNADLEEVLKLATDFIPKIDCWSVCDGFCSGLKMTKNHRERVWEFIQPYLSSDKEYDVRFGVVMLLYYILPEYAPLAFAHFDRIKQEGYYVKMAVAWVLSIYYINLPEQTMEYLQKNELDKFTFNKTLQKITESLRIDQTEKARIKGMKRK